MKPVLAKLSNLCKHDTMPTWISFIGGYQGNLERSKM